MSKLYFDVFLPILVNSAVVRSFQCRANLGSVKASGDKGKSYAFPATLGGEIEPKLYTVEEFNSLTIPDGMKVKNDDIRENDMIVFLKVRFGFGGKDEEEPEDIKPRKVKVKHSISVKRSDSTFKILRRGIAKYITLTYYEDEIAVTGITESKEEVDPDFVRRGDHYKHVNQLRISLGINEQDVDDIVKIAGQLKSIIVCEDVNKIIDSIVDRLGDDPFPLLEGVQAPNQDTATHFFEKTGIKSIKRLTSYESLSIPFLHVDRLITRSKGRSFNFASISSCSDHYHDTIIEMSNDDTIDIGYFYKKGPQGGELFYTKPLDFRYIKERQYTTVSGEARHVTGGHFMTSVVNFKLSTIFATRVKGPMKALIE